MRFAALAFVGLVGLAACGPVTPERAAQLCEERARGAQGPTGSVTLGANSRSGGFAGAQIGVTSDFLRGRDPYDVYEQCVFQRTGQAPVRPPALRR